MKSGQGKRLLLGTTALALVLLAAGGLARRALTGLALRTLLRQSGAAEVKFDVASATPWDVVVENVDFRVRTQAFSARRVTFNRAHWWTPSLGAVRIEQARMPVTIDGSDINPWSWSTYQNGTEPTASLMIPIEEVSVDGQLVIQAAAVPDQTVGVKVNAHFTDRKRWTGRAAANGPGLSVQGEGSFDPATKVLEFKLPEIVLDLKPWQDFVQRLVLLPGGAWALEGRVTASAAGRWVGKEFTATASGHLRDGRLQSAARAITAEGVEADLEFTDLDNFHTQPGRLHIRELRTGRLQLRTVEAEVAFAGPDQLVISRAALAALGGQASLEPFKYFPNQRELDAVLLVDGLDIAEIMGLMPDLPAKATGRVEGRLPVHLDEAGFRLGTGWLTLKPGVLAEIQFNSRGLLTRDVSSGGPSYPVLQKVESGLLKLRLNELRLDIRPPRAPLGSSATLRLAGEPVDSTGKVPVNLDLNVNGPLEKLLSFGMNPRWQTGAGK